MPGVTIAQLQEKCIQLEMQKEKLVEKREKLELALHDAQSECAQSFVGQREERRKKMVSVYEDLNQASIEKIAIDEQLMLLRDCIGNKKSRQVYERMYENIKRLVIPEN